MKEMLEEEHDSNASASNPGSPISVSTAHKHHTDVMAINPRQRLYCQLLSKILSSIASISEATIQYCEVLTTKAEADRQRSGNDDGIAKKCQDWLNELANVISSGVVGAYLHTVSRWSEVACFIEGHVDLYITHVALLLFHLMPMLVLYV